MSQSEPARAGVTVTLAATLLGDQRHIVYVDSVEGTLRT